jgi:hypothetical protein
MKRVVIILALVALVFSGCRQEADYHPYIGESGDLAYNSYASQFDYRITTTLSAITKAILI